MRVAVLSSGGKDSAAAWWWARCKGWTVDCLVTLTITGDDSPMFQIPAPTWWSGKPPWPTLPWVEVRTSGEVPDDLDALAEALRGRTIDGFVSGLSVPTIRNQG